MDFQYEIKNRKLRALVEKKAKNSFRSVDQIIWGYVNRGLMDDSFNEDVFKRLHSKKFLKEVDEALGLD